MTTDNALIKLEGLGKVFYTDEVETHALDNINLEIGKGEYVSIAGPSGCGKSTLLSILGLLDTPTDGKYVLNERPATDLSLSERARVRNREVGFIFQSFNLIGDLTVYENVELPLTYRGMRSAERKQRVTAALERVGMAHRAKHLPSQLSGGQQQRVAVARAVCGEPSILLADEPTGNLDSKNGEAVMELLAELHKSGATICMLLARNAGRAREFAIRRAAGATRLSLIAQVMLESLLLSVTAGLVGLVIGNGLVEVVRQYAPRTLPRLDEASVNGSVLAFTFIVTLVSGVIIGLLPALRSTRAPATDVLRSSSVTSASSRSAGRIRSMLVAVEIAASTVCVVAAMFLLGSFINLLNVDRGFDTAHIVTVGFSFGGPRYDAREKGVQFMNNHIEGHTHSMVQIVHARAARADVREGDACHRRDESS